MTKKIELTKGADEIKILAFIEETFARPGTIKLSGNPRKGEARVYSFIEEGAKTETIRIEKRTAWGKPAYKIFIPAIDPNEPVTNKSFKVNKKIDELIAIMDDMFEKQPKEQKPMDGALIGWLLKKKRGNTGP